MPSGGKQSHGEQIVNEDNYDKEFERVRTAIREARGRLHMTDLQIDVLFHVKMGKGPAIPKSITKKIFDKRRPFRLQYKWAEALGEILKIDADQLFIPDRMQGELPIDAKVQDERDARDLAQALSPDQKEDKEMGKPKEDPASQTSASDQADTPSQPAANENTANPATVVAQKSTPDLAFKKDGDRIYMRLNVYLTREKFNKLKLALPVSKMECHDAGDFIHCVTNTKLEILSYQAGIISNIIYLED